MVHTAITLYLNRRVRLSIITSLLILIASLISTSQPVSADPYIVTNTLNSGSGSLRDAITNANNTPGADTITFAPALDGIPIVLSGAASEDSNTSGDLDITGNGDLTIQGNGVANTIIDGAGRDRVFHICPGSGCTNTVTLSNMTIRNGDAGSGGGIYNEGDMLKVDDIAITANKADDGGGIYNHIVGNVSVKGSTVDANSAIYGGGIFNEGTLNVWNGSTIGGTGTGNSASIDGGGIYNTSYATTIINDSTISGNTAMNDGGGIHNNTNAIVNVSLSTVGTNTATNGAGIYNKANLTVVNTSVGGVGLGNFATDNGGGLYNDGGTSAVIDSSVSSNNASWGAGIYNNFGSSTALVHSNVSANTAAVSGGGICNFATLNIWEGSIIGGTGEGNTATSGGGITTAGNGITTVDASTVSANSATNGGGVFNVNTLNIQNGSIIGGPGAGNTATNWGGGIYNVSGGITTVISSTISANSAEEVGGGIYNKGTSVSVTGSRILNNRATVNGGGLYNDMNAVGSVVVTGNCIAGNSVTSFYNNPVPQQIATGNWWGATPGPNTPGADTTSATVNTSGFLIAPILGCTIDMYLPLMMK